MPSKPNLATMVFICVTYVDMGEGLPNGTKRLKDSRIPKTHPASVTALKRWKPWAAQQVSECPLLVAPLF